MIYFKIKLQLNLERTKLLYYNCKFSYRLIIIIIKVHIISTQKPVYWRVTISSCNGIAAYSWTKQSLSSDLT